MFLYLVCLLVLINAFGPEAVMAQGGCADRIPQSACQQIKNKGNCDSPGFEMIAEYQCKKTCGKC
ncbi:shTK domain protein [Ancylostoma caninum]|uniref:ShTK domain protein n=1 Tax=Ancylostoma caninum TaxID=29170 RepID=A0A368FSS3_ANCCA|nr:shTK domain protein [Ancylostoma caninum]